MAFHFSLDGVLRFKRGIERLERLKLESINSEQALTRARLEDVTRELFESLRQFHLAMSDTLIGSDLHLESEREGKIAELRMSLQSRITDLEQMRITQMQVYVKARQNRESIENLRNRKLELYRLEQSRRQQQEWDDLFVMRQGVLSEEMTKDEPSLPGE